MYLHYNYDVFWDLNEEKDICCDFYKGKFPFSELETSAIKNLLTSLSKVNSVLDLHWKEKINPKHSLLFTKLENEFEKKAADFFETNFKNCENCELFLKSLGLGSWLVKKNQIFALPINLQDNLMAADLDQKDLLKIIRDETKSLDMFFDFHSPALKVGNSGYQKKQFENVSMNENPSNLKFFPFVVELTNESLLDLKGLSVAIQYFSTEFARNLAKISLENENAQFKYHWNNFEKAKLIFCSRSIVVSKMTNLTLTFWMKNKIDFEFEIYFFKNAKILTKVTNLRLSSSSSSLFLSLFAVLLVFCILMILVWKIKNRKFRQNVVEIVNQVRLPE